MDQRSSLRDTIDASALSPFRLNPLYQIVCGMTFFIFWADIIEVYWAGPKSQGGPWTTLALLWLCQWLGSTIVSTIVTPSFPVYNALLHFEL